MQLKLTTDYAIRVMNYLDIHKKASSLELSEQLGISRNYIKKLVTKTGLKNFVKSTSGIHGGFVLRQDAGNVSMLLIIETMEPGLFINRCLENPQSCEGCITFKYDCPIKACYQNVQTLIEEYFKAVTIHDFSLEEESFRKKLEMVICR